MKKIAIVILVVFGLLVLSICLSPLLASEEVAGKLEISEYLGEMEVKVTVTGSVEGDGRRFYLEGIRKSVRFKPIYIVEKLVSRDFIGKYDLSKQVGWEWSFELFLIEPNGKVLIPLFKKEGRVGLSSE